MATLTSPVNAQNVVDRFADYVVATANAGIVWHSGSLPFPEFNAALLGASTGRPIAVSGANLGGPGALITASTIYNTLVTETNRYTNIRLLNAILTIGTGPGNITRSAADARNLTAVAHMAGTTYQGNIGSPANGNVAAGQPITVTSLETLFNNLRSSYNVVRGSAVVVSVNVCHSSCHASCHGSRGRR